jgi:hypothetical protein
MILILPHRALSYIWSWFFPIVHCLIYDHDSSPSCSVLYMILILPRHCHIWSWFFPGSYIRQWRERIRIIYKTVMGKNQDHI